MCALPWSELLAGAAGEPWRTVQVQRTVLVVVHNVTAATRLLDVLPLWSIDHRVQTVFTCVGSSAFTTGTTEFLTAHGVTPIPWHDALRHDFDLAVVASYGGPLHEIKAPLFIIPHGMGYNKTLRKSETGNPVFGLSRHWLVHNGTVIPSVAVLSHDEQLDRLREQCPEAVETALVAGDPCFDRILTSVPLRESYRRGLGARPGQQVVFLSSTWGSASLFGQDPALPIRLVEQLPIDDYRVVMALHPNVWHGHSPWQVRMWLDDCARAGVVVLPPEEGWRAALVAAEVTIGDHGSVTFYSAALGTPLLVTSPSQDALDPDSPIARFIAVAPQLDLDRDLVSQIEAVVDAYHPDRYSALTELATSVPGESARLLRRAIYAELDLAEPQARPAEPVAVPLPEASLTSPSCQLVFVDPVSKTEAAIRRYPAGRILSRHTDAGSVLVTSTREPARRWLELADVVLHEEPCEAPEHWARTSLAALPGCLLAVVRTTAGRWLATSRTGPVVMFTASGDLGPVCGALLHTWMNEGLSPEEFPRTTVFRMGRSCATTTVELAPDLS